MSLDFCFLRLFILLSFFFIDITRLPAARRGDENEIPPLLYIYIYKRFAPGGGCGHFFKGAAFIALSTDYE